MLDFYNSFDIDPYSFFKNEKSKYLLFNLKKIITHHKNKCSEYKNILKVFSNSKDNFSSINEIPFLTVNIFKEYNLKSIDKKETIKILKSSGTTSQNLSKIFLDKSTSAYQVKALNNIVKSFIGNKRMPMLIIDNQDVFKSKNEFSARAAGILGLSNFGRDHTYALDSQMSPRFDILDAFFEKYKGDKILIFGFTFMIWEFFAKSLFNNKKKYNLSNSVLIHSGGWKKLEDEAVSREVFSDLIFERAGISRIINFYGLVEQVGSIFMECKYNHLHTPIYSDIIVRSAHDWKPLKFNEEGIIQLISVLPKSYPGNVLLTEDKGMILGEDDCSCGRKGKYFKVIGRIENVENRGCSDTYI